MRNPDDSTAAGAAGSSTAEGRPRVLVVDDNAVNLLVAAELVRELGYEVVTASGGAEAARIVLAQANFAAVLMDCHMPGTDGYEATRQIRAGEAAGRRTPIIALTANAFEEERQRVAEAGMDDYLTKPARMQLLREMLRIHTGARLDG